jgi:hypothetical protein
VKVGLAQEEHIEYSLHLNTLSLHPKTSSYRPRVTSKTVGFPRRVPEVATKMIYRRPLARRIFVDTRT